MMKHALTNPDRSRRAVAALLAAVLAVGLTGCFPSRGVSGGQTAAAAMGEVKSLPGASSSTYVASDSSHSGFAEQNATTVHINIEPGHHIQDPEALVDFLIRVAWSVNDARPNSSLMVVIDSDMPIDAVTAAQSAGWTSAHAFDDGRNAVFVKLSEAKQRLGAWPGKVPTVPDGLTVTSTASPAP
jgi:hypothetical protein